MGHPAEHFWHWKQARMVSPLARLTSDRKEFSFWVTCTLRSIIYPLTFNRRTFQDSLSPLVNRKFDRKSRSFSNFTSYTNFTSMIFNNSIRSREAQSGSFSHFFCSEKGIEDPGEVFF